MIIWIWWDRMAPGWGAAWQQFLCQDGLAAPTGTLRLSWTHQPLCPPAVSLGNHCLFLSCLG